MQDVKLNRAFSRRAVLAGLAAAGLAAPHVARAAVRTVRFAHNNVADSQFGRGALTFAAAVTADSTLGSALKVEIYDNAQLGDDVSMLKSCGNGTLDGMLCGTSVMSNAVSELGIINAPYLFKDAAQAQATLDGPIGDGFLTLCRSKGLPVLAWGENGVRHITSNKPVRKVEDLRGLKIRVPQAEIMIRGFQALGANAAPLSFGLIREALRSGEFQAQENAISTIEAAKLHEVQTYLCLTGHIYDAIGFIASADLVEDLTKEQLEALTACARLGAAMTRQVAQAAASDGIARLRTAGMTVIDNVDVTGFRTASRPFLEGLSASFDANRLKALLAASA